MYPQVESTKGRRNGIQWTLLEQLEDLDFADDLAILSHSRDQMQNKTTILEETAAKTGIRINKEKTKVMKINSRSMSNVRLSEGELEEVTSFTYLGSIVNTTGGTEQDIKARIGKARTAFSLLNKLWRSREISTRTKVRLFNTNVKSVLLYGSETWRTTVRSDLKIQSCLNNFLRRILRIWWPDKIRNEDLWERTDQIPPTLQVKKKKWTWVGHVIRKHPSSITRQALKWNPQGKRKRGRPRNTWRRSLHKELEEQGYKWKDLEEKAQNRVRWRAIVCGLCSTRSEKASK